MWDKQIYHFVGFRKERGIRWKGLSSSLLDFLISPFSFFHSEHIPVLTVHVANNTNRTTTGQHKNTPKKGNEESLFCGFIGMAINRILGRVGHELKEQLTGMNLPKIGSDGQQWCKHYIKPSVYSCCDFLVWNLMPSNSSYCKRLPLPLLS